MICEDFVNYAANKALRKLGIKEVPGKVAIVPEATYEFEEGATLFPAESMPFAEGETITITIDGVTYSEKAKLLATEGIIPFVYIGNPALAGEGDATEAPYLLFAQDATSVGTGYMFVLVVEDRTSTQHTVAVYKNEGTTTTPIDPKYLPSGGGGGLRTIKLTTPISLDTQFTMLSEDENRQLNEMDANGELAIIEFAITGENHDTETMRTICFAGGTLDETNYFIYTMAYYVIIARWGDEGWAAMVQNMLSQTATAKATE